MYCLCFISDMIMMLIGRKTPEIFLYISVPKAVPAKLRAFISGLFFMTRARSIEPRPFLFALVHPHSEPDLRLRAFRGSELPLTAVTRSTEAQSTPRLTTGANSFFDQVRVPDELTAKMLGAVRMRRRTRETHLRQQSRSMNVKAFCSRNPPADAVLVWRQSSKNR